MTARTDSTVAKILGYQLLVILVVTAGFTVIGNEQQILSAMLGGIAAFVPNLAFSLWMYKTSGQGARKVVNTFYIAEAIKWLLTIALFVMIFQIPTIQIFALLVSYITALSVFWFALLMR